MINAISYGFKSNDPAFDNSVIFNQFLSDPNRNDTELFFPAGTFYFLTQTNVISKTLNIRGCGPNNTNLMRSFSGNLVESTATVIIENFSIHAINKKNGAAAVQLTGLGASASILRNLYITSPDGTTYIAAVILNGGNQTLGVRGCYLEQIETFACTGHCVWMVNVKGLTLNSVQGYLAGGTVQHMTIQNIGSFRSSNILISTRYLPTLYTYSSDNIKVISAGGTAISNSGSTNVTVV